LTRFFVGEELPLEVAMSQTTILLSLSVLASLLSPSALLAQPRQPSVEDLKRQVEEKEKVVNFAQAELALARTRLAKAEGKKELAIAEGLKVLSYRESVLKDVQKASGRICSPWPFEEALGEVAIARVWLAELEGRRDDLRAELPKVIAWYEFQIKHYKRAFEVMVIAEKEAKENIKECEEKLRQARDRLASLATSPANKDKPEKNGK
jgi:hypothetical protein